VDRTRSLQKRIIRTTKGERLELESRDGGARGKEKARICYCPLVEVIIFIRPGLPILKRVFGFEDQATAPWSCLLYRVLFSLLRPSIACYILL
jgi:hypothetical protein